MCFSSVNCRINFYCKLIPCFRAINSDIGIKNVLIRVFQLNRKRTSTRRSTSDAHFVTSGIEDDPKAIVRNAGAGFNTNYFSRSEIHPTYFNFGSHLSNRLGRSGKGQALRDVKRYILERHVIAIKNGNIHINAASQDI